MPRCFLAKKSTNSSDDDAKWDEDVSNNNRNNNSEVAEAHGLNNVHMSTVGSITAAKAVLSIQQPLPATPTPTPPASVASVASSATSITKLPMNNLNNNVENNNNRGTQTMASWPEKSTSPKSTTISRPPRRKKQRPVNLSVATIAASEKTTSFEAPSGLTILRKVTAPPIGKS